MAAPRTPCGCPVTNLDRLSCSFFLEKVCFSREGPKRAGGVSESVWRAEETRPRAHTACPTHTPDSPQRRDRRELTVTRDRRELTSTAVHTLRSSLERKAAVLVEYATLPPRPRRCCRGRVTRRRRPAGGVPPRAHICQRRRREQLRVEARAAAYPTAAAAAPAAREACCTSSCSGEVPFLHLHLFLRAPLPLLLLLLLVVHCISTITRVFCWRRCRGQVPITRSITITSIANVHVPNPVRPQ